MNPLIKAQLDKINYINLPHYDEETNYLIIPKCGNPPPGTITIELQEGKYYLIMVEDYIIKPFDGFTLHDNWNKGIPPKHKYMKVEILKIMGNMININSIGFDNESKMDIMDSWVGWLPKKSITTLQELI